MDTNQAAQVTDFIVDWLKQKVNESHTKGYVVGLSGGLDSSVVALLCQRAFPDETLGIIMNCHSTPQDAAHGKLLAKQCHVPYKEIFLDKVYDSFLEAVETTEEEEAVLTVANIKPRLRMTTLYYYGSKHGYLVVGTGNRPEMKIGYFTKYGDGGVDIEPIIHLTKSEVRDLARYLGVPDAIINKPPSAGLWENQTDEDEMGFTYDDIDHYLLTGEAAPAVKAKIEHMAKISDHKKHSPSMPPVPPGLKYKVSFYIDEA